MKYRQITSPTNPLIKELLSTRKRRHSPYVLIEGERVLSMALSSGVELKMVLFSSSYASKHAAFLRGLSKRAGELIETTEQVVSRLTETETPQGVIGYAIHRRFALETVKVKATPLMVIIDGVQDPGNLGTIIRTADAAGADAVVILPGTCDHLTPKVVRATAGSIFNLPVVSAETDLTVRWLRGKGISLIAADPRAASTVFEADLTRPSAFVFGNEAHGITEALRQASDAFVRVPLLGRAESLNVASSAAICLYEALRQRTVSCRPPGQCRRP